ncbi:DUF5915 domain-containing protein [Thermodesulfobacteriota bacterium]
MRDLLRHLQVLRKKIGLEIEDRIELTWSATDVRIREVFPRWADLLKSELLCTQQREGDISENCHEINIGEIEVKVDMFKA